LKDYRKSFLLHPVDSLAKRIRGEGYHTRIESYREAAIRLYDQDAHTTAEYAKEVMLHGVTKHELTESTNRIAWIQAQRDTHYEQVQQLKHELAEYRDKEAHFAQFEDDPTDLRGPGDD